MAEKADGTYDPGGEGGGFGGGAGDGTITLSDGDAGYDEIVDRYNETNRSGHELADPSDPDSQDPKKKKKVTVAPPAPPVDHSAPLGSRKNPVVVPSKRGSQY